MVYPENFDEKSGFTGIRKLVSDLCLCNLGREHAARMTFLTRFGDIILRLKQTEEFRRILLFGEELPLGYISDSTPGLSKLRVEGMFMELNELFELNRSLDTARAVINYFNGRNAESYPALKALSGNATVPAFIRDKLVSILTREGKMKDNASPELLSVRRNITLKQSAVSKKLHAVMKEAQSAGIVEGDSGIAIRNGRPVIPVSASMKRKIPGIIHDESASGKTAYIEPSVVMELNNEIRELEYAENREVVRILREVADSMRPYLEELLRVFRYLGLMDFIRAKAMLAVRTRSVLPVVCDKPYIEWKNAVHPLLYLNLKKENRETVPLDIELDENNRILVISGPNAGGKSVCLQTVGLLQYMLQCGLLVPVAENSGAGLFDSIFIDIGDEQSIENDLSTYSSHLTNMKHFIRHAGPRSLILIDEFGSGTEPVLGGAIAESILERLNDSRTFGVITTHYSNLKHFAASTPGIINGAMLFDTGRMEPLFRLESGKPGSSFAFEIARKIGLPEEILRSASGRAGEDHIDFDRHLKDIIRDKHYWERKRKNIRQLEKKLEADLGLYGSLLEAAEKEKKAILMKAREEARQLLEGVNRTIENTIREIREAQAEKERTKEARKRLEEIRQKAVESDTAEGSVENRVSRVRSRQEGLAKKIYRVAGDKPVSRKAAGEATDAASIGVGDHVRLSGGDITGEVLDVNGRSIMVAFGNMVTTVDEKKLEKLGRGEIKKAGGASSVGLSSALRDKKLNFRAEKDVRGMRADEALEKVSLFIDDALMVGAREVRILHGKGNGILRQLIREYLGGVSLVKKFRDEHVEMGGSGITVVELEN
jgi:DNA mismatch repair protein MutS2